MNFYSLRDTTTYGNGFIAFASWRRPSGQAITHDSTTWIVPSQPTGSHGQAVFIFNGLEIPDTVQGQAYAGIIQPVLEWGASSDGGGTGWGVNCYYEDFVYNLYGTRTNVAVGDSVFGTIDSVAEPVNEFETLGGLSLLTDVL